MALGSDAVSPEDAVKTRKKVFDDYLSTTAAQEKNQQYARQKLARDSAAGVAQKMGGSPTTAGLGALGVIGEAAGAGTKMLGKQAQETDASNVLGAKMQQDIAGAKTTQALTNLGGGLARDADSYAKAAAEHAFSRGLESKKLIFHTNSAVSDYAFERLAQDYEQGRVDKVELQSLMNNLALRAEQRKIAADEGLRAALQEFKVELASGNAARAKARIQAAIDAQKDAMKDAAKAGWISSIISGGAKGASVLIGGKG